LEHAPPVSARHQLARAGHRTAVLALSRAAGAEARGGGAAPEPPQRVVPVPHAPLVPLAPIVLLAAGAVADADAQRRADGARGGVVPVRRDRRGGAPGAVVRPGEAAPRRVHVAPLAESRVDAVAVAVERPIPGAPAPVDPEIGRVRVPVGARHPAPPGPSLCRQQRGAARRPLPNGFVGADAAAFQEQRGEVAQTTRVAQPPQDDAHDQGGRILAVSISRAGSLVARPATGAAAEGARAERRAARLFGGRVATPWGQGTRTSCTQRSTPPRDHRATALTSPCPIPDASGPRAGSPTAQRGGVRPAEPHAPPAARLVADRQAPFGRRLPHGAVAPREAAVAPDDVAEDRGRAAGTGVVGRRNPIAHAGRSARRRRSIASCQYPARGAIKPR